MNDEQFPSLSAIPGVTWEPLVPLEWADHSGRHTALIGADIYGYRYRQMAPHAIAATVGEMLERPGTRGGYHFVMLAGWVALYTKRRDHPRALGWVETLCLADVRLMECGPELVFDDPTRDRSEAAHLARPAFEKLSNLYQSEGFLSAAVDIERRLAALGTNRPAGEDVIARQAALLEDDDR